MPDPKYLFVPKDDDDDPPIPTYEEATSSRPVSSASLSRYGAANEGSERAERQNLLNPNAASLRTESRRRNGYYQAPSVQSVSDSEDDGLDGLGEDDDDDDDDEDDDEGGMRGLRRDMEQMEVLDEVERGDRRRARGRLRGRWKRGVDNMRTRLSAISLPRWRIPLPSVSLGFVTDRLGFLYIPEQYRPSWPIVARLFGLFVLVSVAYLLVVGDFLGPAGMGFDQLGHASVRDFVQSSVDEVRIRDHLRHISAFDHVAGSEGDLFLARYVEQVMRASGLDDVETEELQVHLNYPKANGRKVAIVDGEGAGWQAKLEEESVYKDPSPSQKQTWNFHGLSKAGSARGPLIYANYGSKADFKSLWDSGVDVNGSVVLLRAGGTQSSPGLKVKQAELAGAVACLIYSDPAEDGFVKGRVWPDGPLRPADSVQRGAVAMTNLVVGDVLTPGWASTQKSDRLSEEKASGLVNIPSLPLAWRDAQKLLQVIKGHGQELSDDDWKGGVPDLNGWWTGDPSSPVIEVLNDQDEEQKQKIWNVFGIVKGAEESGKKLIVGHHRDAWCFGAAEAGSGTAIMLEMVRILGLLRQQGWRPLRSIHFASWDAAEYNFIGSTEYVESNLDSLRDNAVAYLNIGAGITGDSFRAAGSPLLEKTLLRALDRVSDPVQNVTLKQLWEENRKKVEALGTDGDYVPFQDLAGCASLDMGFAGQPFPRHSCYDTFERMELFGDPSWAYHKILAQIWVLMIVEIAQQPLVPMDLRSYVLAMKEYVNDLQTWAESKGAQGDGEKALDFASLWNAVALFDKNAHEFHAWEDWWYGEVYGRGGFESNRLALSRMSWNQKISQFDTKLLDLPADKKDKEENHGIPGRNQFKHSVLGPAPWSNDPASFPAVRDALDPAYWGQKPDYKAAQVQLDKAARLLTTASQSLFA